jgi:hypothetical protein
MSLQACCETFLHERVTYARVIDESLHVSLRVGKEDCLGAGREYAAFLAMCG